MPSIWQSRLFQVSHIGARSYARVRPRLGGEGGEHSAANSNVKSTLPNRKVKAAQKEARVLLHKQARETEAPAPSPASNASKTRITPITTISASSNLLITKIPPSILYDHWDLAPPSARDLYESRNFFARHAAKPLFSATKLVQIPFTSVPEVAIIGRSNVGKSTLINALLKGRFASTSSKPGKTKTMNAYDLGNGKMTLLDMPGYGRASRAEWGVEITKYLQQRKELRRVFVLVDVIRNPDEGRVKEEDLVMLQQLRELRIPHQIVVAKVDRALFPLTVKPPLTEQKLAVCERNVKAVFADVKRIIWGLDEDGSAPQSVAGNGLLPFGQLLAVTAQNSKWERLGDRVSGALGIDALRWAFLVATGLVKTLPSQVAKAKKSARLAKVDALGREVALGGISG